MRADHPFLRASSPELTGERRTVTFEEAWYQGRGVYGGVVAGALIREMTARVRADADDGADARPLRWLTVHFCAPATGVGELRAETLRRGSSVTHLRSELVRDGTMIAFASATYARARPAAKTWVRPTMPQVPPPSTIAPFTAHPSPTFTSHFELRFCHGPPPLSGAQQAEMGAWIRFAEPLVLDAPAAMGILDAAPPAAMATMNRMRPMATVALACQFFEPLPLANAKPDDHYLLIVRSNVSGDGYSEELDELWSADGRLLALCWQTIAHLG
jgi:acyl-CoA thioesterase